MIKTPAKVKAEENVYITETERSSGWLSCSSLEMLKASFNVPSDDQGSHPADISVSVILLQLMLGLYRIATNLGPIYELKNYGFFGLVTSQETFIIRSQTSVYIDVGERLTYEETKSV